MISWLIVFSRLGNVRLKKWYKTEQKQKKDMKDAVNLILSRSAKDCSFLTMKNTKLVYKRYASLYFCLCIDEDDNELITLEIIHRLVQALDLRKFKTK